MRLDLATLHTAFYEMEEAEGLFDRQSDDGTYFWDIVRNSVFVGLQGEYGGPFKNPGSTTKASPIATGKNAVKALLNRFTQGYLSSREPEYLFYTVQRTLTGSRLLDMVADPLFELIGERSIAVEAVNWESISFLDMLLRRRTRVPTVFIYDPPESGPLQSMADTISVSIAKYFDRLPDVASVIRDPLAHYKQYKEHFGAVFARHKPKAVLVVNHGPLKGLFAAARESGIPTLELQHGTPSVESPFWSYPTGIPSTHPGLTLPTAHLVFSEYFKGITRFPVAHTCAIGNDYLHQEPLANTADAVAIIAAYMYQEDLVRLAVALAESFPTRRIYFRLHPHQFAQKAEIAAQMRHRQNIVVQTDEMSLTDLFAATTFVIGVHSTVLYSALQARKKVMIYRISNYFMIQDVFPFVELFDSVADAVALIREHTISFPNFDKAPTYFEPLDRAAFFGALTSVGSSAPSCASAQSSGAI
jgi:hypothetical protein